MKPLRLLACMAALLLAWGRAHADTACPTVSTVTSVVTAFITGSPVPITLATYDLTTHGLTIQYAANRANYLVGVPRQLIVGRASTPWAAIQNYPHAMVQDRSPCPVLSATGSPIIVTGLSFPTESPFVQSPCPTATGPDRLQLVGLRNTPFRVYLAVYDFVSQYFFVQFSNNTSALFVGVPQAAVRGVPDWNSFAAYTEAIMTQNSGCPVLAGGTAPPPAGSGFSSGYSSGFH